MKTELKLVCAMVAISCFSATVRASTPSWSYEQQKVLKGEFPIRTVCMMPAEGKLSKTGMKGGEGMSKQSDDWTTTLQTMVEAHLKSAGVDILQASDPLASGASDDEIRQVILQLNQKYGDVSSQLNKHPKDIGKSRYTIGDDSGLLPCSAKSDVIVFVEGEGQVTTGGKKAMGVFVPDKSNTSYATLILTMADAKTGEILVFSRLNNGESFGEKFVDQTESVYGKALDKQFERLRIGRYADKKKH